MYFFGQLFISGFVVGSVYALIGVAIVVIFKTTEVFNFAQGALMLVGAYVCWSLAEQLGLPMIVGIFLTMGFSIILGLTASKLFIQPLIGQPILSVIMMTLVLSVFLESFVNLFWGGPAKAYPELFSEEPILLGEFVLSVQHLIILAFVCVILVAMGILFKYSRWGLQMRTVAEDHQSARACGLNVKGCVCFVLGYFSIPCGRQRNPAGQHERRGCKPDQFWVKGFCSGTPGRA